jgi:hypothetical protein
MKTTIAMIAKSKPVAMAKAAVTPAKVWSNFFSVFERLLWEGNDDDVLAVTIV